MCAEAFGEHRRGVAVIVEDVRDDCDRIEPCQQCRAAAGIVGRAPRRRLHEEERLLPGCRISGRVGDLAGADQRRKGSRHVHLA